MILLVCNFSTLLILIPSILTRSFLAIFLHRDNLHTLPIFTLPSVPRPASSSMSTVVAKDDVRPLRAAFPVVITNDAELLLSCFMVETMTAMIDDTEAQPHHAKGMPEGWTQTIVCRKRGVIPDKYWFSPKESYNFNAEVKVRRFLAIQDQVGGDEVVETVCIRNAGIAVLGIGRLLLRVLSAGVDHRWCIGCWIHQVQKKGTHISDNVANVNVGVHDPTI